MTGHLHLCHNLFKFISPIIPICFSNLLCHPAKSSIIHVLVNATSHSHWHVRYIHRQSEEREEQEKFGVFFDDDYNYLQHLRGVKEAINWDEEELEVYTIRREDPQVGASPLLCGTIATTHNGCCFRPQFILKWTQWLAGNQLHQLGAPEIACSIVILLKDSLCCFSAVYAVRLWVVGGFKAVWAKWIMCLLDSAFVLI